MCIGALFKIAKNWEPKCSSKDDWKKLIYADV